MAMNSVGILCMVLLTLIATTNAVECLPTLCTLNCGDYGFQFDSRGCAICRCRTLSNDCFEPIAGYNCGFIDRRGCPSTHYCQLDSTGLRGQCCLAIA
ncbi:unnamed protein product [Rotaria sp. Silwood1]|nr:unnamed protein product [Rotaria sp. Silwood1]CAF3885319.1 unnamed protein product [Rotaria sp. Silwood1]CAF3946420.1 unnamed protein product [Rotaria sp. Silwood1]CAF3987013.1 unnamed protein product [Rotaria sp. Silwood1]CAF4832330.1 unnamed protein product [Rotaria sp. Silwood1]